MGKVVRLLPLTALLLLSLSSPVRAGLFEDDEARKAILDLRNRLTELENAYKGRSEQLSDQLTTAQRAGLDLAGQIEGLKSEIAKLRGQNEQLARDLAETQRKLTDLQQGLDARLRPLEPQKVSVDGKEFLADPDERRQFEAAMAQIRRGEFAEAVAGFNAFLKRYPSGGYVDAARFWLGNAQYGKRDYKDAIATFRGFVAASPEHPRAAEALLALANCQIELKDNKGARRSLEEVLRSYPGSEAARAAKERIAALR